MEKGMWVNGERWYRHCNPDIRELSGPDTKSLISGFFLYPVLVYFV